MVKENFFKTFLIACTHSVALTLALIVTQTPFKRCGFYEKLIIGVNVALLLNFPNNSNNNVKNYS